MGSYMWQKVVGFVLTVLLISALTFMILQILPGDPALLMLGTDADPQAYLELRDELDLNRPVVLRYFDWLLGFGKGSWGRSVRYSLPVRELVGDAIGFSVILACLAVFVSVVIAIPIGIFIATKPRNVVALFLAGISQVGMAIPQFWLGLLLIQYFAVRHRILPAGGNDSALSLILPVLTLALPRAAVLIRFVSLGLVEALEEDYIRTAKAKGLPWQKVLYKHALRNGSLAVFTVAGLQFAQLLAGTIVVEQVFGLPGMGQLLLAGVMQRDLPLVQALMMVIVIGILLVNLMLDLTYGLLDPRVRFE